MSIYSNVCKLIIPYFKICNPVLFIRLYDNAIYFKLGLFFSDYLNLKHKFYNLLSNK